jgi:hypothetical protein
VPKKSAPPARVSKPASTTPPKETAPPPQQQQQQPKEVPRPSRPANECNPPYYFDGPKKVFKPACV